MSYCAAASSAFGRIDAFTDDEVLLLPRDETLPARRCTKPVQQVRALSCQH
jgi:hypothetical protein